MNMKWFPPSLSSEISSLDPRIWFGLLRERQRVLPLRDSVSGRLEAGGPTVSAVTRLRTLLRDAWLIARPYWYSDDRWAGPGLLLVVVALTLGQVYINVLLNRWNNTFYNALQDTDYAVFVRQVIRFSWLAAAYI